tara:strand:- start:24 stop:698 length:675 start_codon:yes stop_codon:yes gene_type:complete
MRTSKSIREGKSEKIIELGKIGYSYGQINKETGYSKSSISYHLGEGQKEKAKKRHEKRSKGFKRKVFGFIYSSRKPKEPFVYKTSEIRKKGREFFYGDKRRKSSQYTTVKQPRIWQYWGKLFPGITSKEEEVQAVNQWTGKPDFYDNDEPIMYPYVRCKLTDEIVNVKGNDIHVDHADGDRTNNSIENFTVVKNWANMVKGECKSYKEVEEKLTKILTTIRKYK